MKIMKNFVKLVMVFCIAVSQITPVISVFADIITNDVIAVNIDTTDDNIIIKSTTDNKLDDENEYSLNFNIKFIYMDGEVAHSANYNTADVGLKIKGSDINSGYRIDNIDVILNDLGFKQYEKGFYYESSSEKNMIYAGTYVVETQLYDSENNKIGSVVNQYSSKNEDIYSEYSNYLLNDGINDIYFSNNVSISEVNGKVKVYGRFNDNTLNPNKEYYVTGLGYNSNVLYKGIDLFYNSAILEYDFTGKLPGIYVFTNDYTLTDTSGISKNYSSTFTIKYGNLDDKLSSSGYTFKDGYLIIEGEYNQNSLPTTTADIYNVLVSAINNSNYNVEIIGNNGINNLNDILKNGDKVIISGENYYYEYTVLIHYDYDNDGYVTYNDLDHLINEKLGNEEIKLQTTLGDNNFILNNNILRNVQKDIDNLPSPTFNMENILVNTDNSEIYNGNEVRVTYNVESINAVINNISGILNYDNNYLKLQEVLVNDTFVGNINNENEFYYAGQGITNGDIITFVFKAIKAGDTSVNISSLELNNYENNYPLDSNSNLVSQIKINKSNDADLEYLNIKEANIDFDYDKTEYDVEIGTEIEKLTIDYLTKGIGASAYFVNPQDNKDYVVGETKTLIIKVVAEDGTIKEYKINVTKKLSTNSTLNNIEVSGYNLEFNSNQYEYLLKVDSSVNSLSIIPYLNDSKATYTIIGNENFQIGLNTIIIKVVAEDGTSSEYVIKVYKEDANSNKTTSENINNETTTTNEELVVNENQDQEIALPNSQDKSLTNIKKKNSSTVDDNKKMTLSKIIIIILIILVIGGLVYLIFKDTDDEIAYSKNKKEQDKDNIKKKK